MRPPSNAAFTAADPRADGQADSVRGGLAGRRVRAPALPGLFGGARGPAGGQPRVRAGVCLEEVHVGEPCAHARRVSTAAAGRPGRGAARDLVGSTRPRAQRVGRVRRRPCEGPRAPRSGARLGGAERRGEAAPQAAPHGRVSEAAQARGPAARRAPAATGRAEGRAPRRAAPGRARGVQTPGCTSAGEEPACTLGPGAREGRAAVEGEKARGPGAGPGGPPPRPRSWGSEPSPPPAARAVSDTRRHKGCIFPSPRPARARWSPWRRR
ncbi:collagen alpha-1(I) chain-like isoform X2 [Meriones unguiculatus]|nr:collagen alpha-1(I) chain-like isoform X2 [Meriones unguiculatus]